MLALGALTEGEQICIAVKIMTHINPVGHTTMRRWIDDGTSLSWGYERLYRHFQEDALFNLAEFFTLVAKKGIDPDDFLAGCRLLGIQKCRKAGERLKDLPDRPVLLSRPQD